MVCSNMNGTVSPIVFKKSYNQISVSVLRFSLGACKPFPRDYDHVRNYIDYIDYVHTQMYYTATWVTCWFGGDDASHADNQGSIPPLHGNFIRYVYNFTIVLLWCVSIHSPHVLHIVDENMLGHGNMYNALLVPSW